MRAAYGIEEVVEAVSNHFNIMKSEVMTKKSLKVRNMAIYLIKEKTGETNRMIGEFFDGLTCSAVAKIYRKVTLDMRRDRKLKRIIHKIQKNLDTFKP